MKKQHHTVSEFYLRGFAGPAPTDDKPDGFWVYRRGQSEPQWLAPESVSIRSHFYSYRDDSGKRNTDMEDLLGQLEGAVAPIIRKLIAPHPRLADEHEMVRLAFFIAIAYTRTAKHREVTIRAVEADRLNALKKIASDDHMLSAVIERYNAERAANLGIDELRKGIEGVLTRNIQMKLNDRGQLSYSLAPAAAICSMILHMNWTLLRTAGSAEFVTSDSPVVVGVEGELPDSWVSPNVEVAFPLDRRHCLLLSSGGAAGVVVNCSADDVREIVKRTALQADREVYCPHKNAVVARHLN